MTDFSSDRRRQVEALISEALKMPPDQRTQFLDTRCAGNSELCEEVKGLLESGEHPATLARPPSSGTPRVMASGKLLSHYKIISMLGAGGMGEVYLAEDTQLRRRVALKMIVPSLSRDERGLRRFEQEAQAASALNHPNILTVYEFGQADGVHYIASEFVEGITLRNKMAISKLDLSAAIDIAIQIASALAAAHECGIVHRDIKPDNVIVRTDGIVKVLDFGIAKLSRTFVDDTIQHSSATVTSSISEPGMGVPACQQEINDSQQHRHEGIDKEPAISQHENVTENYTVIQTTINPAPNLAVFGIRSRTATTVSNSPDPSRRFFNSYLFIQSS